MDNRKSTRRRASQQPEPIEPAPIVNREQKRIAQWLNKVKFRKQLFGGVSERDVWKKITELNELYNEAIFAERVRYNTLLDQWRRANQAGGNARKHYSNNNRDNGGEGE
ncbi:MAG: hypothetical protein GX096_05390 [Clostridiales bacterium]|nr:hypothetical protein [Clostridiales bacterium]